MSEARPFVWTASDGYAWKYRQLDPADKPCGEIVVLHGIQSHGGWYEETASWLARRGWRVALLDRRGSGRNENSRGDCPSFRRLLDDIAEFIGPIGRPVVVMGISWGAKLAVALQKRHPDLCKGLVLIGPGFRPKIRPRLRTRLAVVMNRLTDPGRLLPIPLNSPELFTANPARQLFIRNDPLALHEATARFLWESRRLDFYLGRAARRVTVPSLVLLGQEDRIVDIRRTRRFVSRFRGPISIIEYPRAQHTLDFEPDGPPYLDDLAGWLGRLSH